MIGGVQFGRSIRVEVYESSGVARTITDLHVSFDVEARSGRKPNEAEIRIYNLSPTTRSAIRADTAGVRLFAGYGGKPRKIFEGAVVSANSSPEGNVDFLTTIRASDGFKNTKERFTARTFPAGTALLDLFAAVIDDLGLPARIEPTAGLASARLLRSRTLDAKSEKCLSGLCDEAGLDWTIDFGVLRIAVAGEKDPAAALVVLAPTTGLVGVPSVTTEKFRGEVRKRITARALLSADFRPGVAVKIESSRFEVPADLKVRKGAPELTASGIYVLDSVKFSGDNFGGDFDAEVSGYGN